MTSLNSMKIVSSGIGLPNRILTNAEIKKNINPNIDIDWVDQKLGIKERRIAHSDTFTSDLAVSAATQCLERANVGVNEVDLIIVATATPDFQAPSTACIVQGKMGINNAFAFDVSAVCSGFLYGLSTASMFIQAGQVKKALVIGADTFSKITDWTRRDCVFFGDGAGAVLLESDNQNKGLFDCELFSDGAKHNVWKIGRGEEHFVMDANGVYENACRAVPQCIERLLDRHNLTQEDISVVVPHQPSNNLLHAISDKVDVPINKFRINLDKYANTAGATIPIALSEAIDDAAFEKDDLVLFAAAGAGFTAGAAIYRWPS